MKARMGEELSFFFYFIDISELATRNNFVGSNRPTRHSDNLTDL
jgi:hypothetical protein